MDGAEGGRGAGGPGTPEDPTERWLKESLQARAGAVDPGPAPRVDAVAAHAAGRRPPGRWQRWTTAAAVAAGVAVVAVTGTVALRTEPGPEPVAAPTSAPTQAASTGPVDRPTADPTPDPTADPTADPTRSSGPAPTIVSAAPSPSGGASPGRTATEAATTATATVIVWASVLDARSVAEGNRTGRVVAERRPVDLPAGADVEDRVSAAVTSLTSEPPRDPDYYTGWWWEPGTAGGVLPFDGATPVPVDVTPSGTTVDLPVQATRAPLGAFGTLTVVDELVRTVVSNGGTSPVTVLVDGEVADLWGAVRLEEPVTAGPELLTGGWILDPYEGQRVAAGPVTVSGTGTAFEANVLWDVTDSDGTVVAEGSTSAGANGEYGPFGFTVELDPGRYTVAVREPSMAGEDEGPALVWQDTKTIEVVG